MGIVKGHFPKLPLSSQTIAWSKWDVTVPLLASVRSSALCWNINNRLIIRKMEVTAESGRRRDRGHMDQKENKGKQKTRLDLGSYSSTLHRDPWLFSPFQSICLWSHSDSHSLIKSTFVLLPLLSQQTVTHEVKIIFFYLFIYFFD